MLRILTGRAGSGKTTEIFRRMAAEGQQRKQILLVPEQASFETEQRFCRENGNRAGVYGEVLSFTRLENRVLTLAGGVAQPVLDEGGRLLTMYAALRSVSAHLTVYAMPSRRPEFLGSLLTTMDELKSCCVTGEALAQVGAVAILSLPENRGKIALFGGVKNARFKRQVIPGDVLELECTLTKRRGPVGIGVCTATVNGETACTAELIFAIQ